MSERYTHGHHGSVVANHAQRTAASSASFLLERLSKSMRLLDIGCGPGSITLDLAERVSMAVGVDAAPEAIEAANELAAGRSDVRFQLADAYELPFDDNSFDVVFAHQVLQHLADPVAALIEARRVTAPGGLVAVRDADYGSMVHSPHEPRIDRWRSLYDAVARKNGGEPNAGRHLVGWFSAAGFERIAATSSTWTYHEPAAVRTWSRLWISRLTEAGLGELALEFELSDQADLDELAEGWRSWAASPGAYFAFLHGEVIGEV